MHWDEPFPLEAVPTRVRHAILKEFEGRHPSTGQIAAIPGRLLALDPRHWTYFS